ncbi:MAG: hypothetical protein U9Q85_03710 [Patescibacteria group bacterium]|nr:hypothetical protein [Patescibacteria group bacterium]
MKKQEKTQFEDFLKNLFWQKTNTPEINPGIFSAKINNKKRSNNSFKNILNKIESEKHKDFDDFSAFLWKKHFQKHKNNFEKSKASDYLNQEINPHAHIDIFLDDKDKKSIIKFKFSPIVVVASAIILAMVLSVSIVYFNPLLAKKLVVKSDALILNSIEKAYCKILDDKLLCYPIEKDLVIKPKPGKNIFASYIIDNQEKLQKNNQQAIVIKEKDLDGRVAGVFEQKQTQASRELKELSENKPAKKPNKAAITRKILDKIFNVQKELVLKIQNKLINLVF